MQVNKAMPPGKHVIAVRIAFDPGIPTTRPYVSAPIFELNINTSDRRAVTYAEDQHFILVTNLVYALLAGIYFIIFATFLSLYIYDGNRAYLFYTLASFVGTYNSILGIGTLTAHSTMWIVYIIAISQISNSGMFFITLTVYALFDYPKRLFVSLYGLFAVMAAAIIFFDGTIGVYLFTYGVPLLNVVQNIRVTVWARRQHKKGGILYLAGGILFFSLFLLFTVLPFYYSGMVIYVAALIISLFP